VVVRFARTDGETSQGKLCILRSVFAGFTTAVPNGYWASPTIAGLPDDAGLVSGFCSSNPSWGHRLSSDSASRRTPLP